MQRLDSTVHRLDHRRDPSVARSLELVEACPVASQVIRLQQIHRQRISFVDEDEAGEAQFGTPPFVDQAPSNDASAPGARDPGDDVVIGATRAESAVGRQSLHGAQATTRTPHSSGSGGVLGLVELALVQPRSRPRRAAMSSSWLPCSTMSPVLHAPGSCRRRGSCDSRWAMTKLVRPWRSSAIACWISTSVRVSTELVASSRIRIAGSARNARAIVISCFSPR